MAAGAEVGLVRIKFRDEGIEPPQRPQYAQRYVKADGHLAAFQSTNGLAADAGTLGNLLPFLAATAREGRSVLTCTSAESGSSARRRRVAHGGASLLRLGRSAKDLRHQNG